MIIKMKLIKRSHDGKLYESITTIAPWTDIEGAELMKALWDIERAINDHTDTRCHIEIEEN